MTSDLEERPFGVSKPEAGSNLAVSKARTIPLMTSFGLEGNITFGEVKIVQGSCLCGEVKFEVSEVVGPFELCHCNRCRKVKCWATGKRASISISFFAIPIAC